MAETASLEQTLAALEDLERVTTKQGWAETLEPRKQAEIEFHDLKRERVDGNETRDHVEEWANQKYYSTTRKSRDHLDSWSRRHNAGKVVLDYACGNGTRAIQAAKEGATMSIGIDISAVSIENARILAQEAGVADRVRFVVADAEDTGLPDNCVDIVYCMGVLHHLDLNHALPEIARLLKPGGIALGLEALAYNPLIRLYRKRTPHLRTDWEKDHILSHKDLRLARRWFDVKEVRYWHMASLLATPFRRSKAFGGLLKAGELVDAILARTPLINRMAWMFSFELHKRAE